MPSRRAFLAGLGATGTAATAGCLGEFDAAPGSDEAYDWPTGGGNEWNSRAVPNGVAPRDDPTIDRTHEFDGIPAGDPVVTDGTVLLNTGVNVVALDRGDLSRRWAVAPDDNDAFRYAGAPAVADGVAYVPERDTLVARDLDTGERLWSRAFEYVFGETTPLVVDRGDGHRVVIGAGEYLRAFDGATGERQWERRLDRIVRRAAARTRRRRYTASSTPRPPAGSCTRSTTTAACAGTGPSTPGSAPRRPSSRPAGGRRVDTGVGDVVVGAGDGSVRCFGPTGKLQWRAGLRGFAEGESRLVTAECSRSRAGGWTRWTRRTETARGGPISEAPFDRRRRRSSATRYTSAENGSAGSASTGASVSGPSRLGETRFEREVDGGASYVTAADGRLFATVATETSDGRLAVLS